MLPAQRAVRALPCCNQDTQRTRSPPEVHPSSRRAGWPRRRRRRGGAWRACWVGGESWGEVGGASAWALGRSSKADVQSESFPACSDDVVLFCWSCWHACWLSNSTNTCVCRSKIASSKLRTGTPFWRNDLAPGNLEHDTEFIAQITSVWHFPFILHPQPVFR